MITLFTAQIILTAVGIHYAEKIRDYIKNN